MVKFQQTLKQAFTVSGKGLHTGQMAKAVFNPAPENFGIKFKRIVDGQEVEIPALVDYVTETDRGTVITKDGVSVSTIEHALAALTGFHVHNCLIEIDGPELPILDGSSIFFAEQIEQVGVEEQGAIVEYLEIKEKIVYKDEEKGIEIIALPDEEYSVNAQISYPMPILRNQYATYSSKQNFKDELASCRTFVFVSELEPLLNANLVKGGDLDNAIIFIDKSLTQKDFDHLTDLFHQPHMEVKPEGILNNISFHYDNEPARHKLLDVIGDLTLVGMPIKGRIIATKPGHTPNIEFAKLLRREVRKLSRKAPEFNPNDKPVMDIARIKELLPHRYPFLMIDKVVAIEGDTIIGVKNVTGNEAFFQGHFPEEPVVPGVLQIEAMAQTGGLLVLNTLDEPERYSTYFLTIDKVKFRKKVVPGDVIIFKIVMSSPIRRGCAYMRGEAYVGDSIVAEAEFMAQITKNK